MNTQETLRKLDNGTYQNSTTLDVGGLPISVRDLLVKAPLISGLNVFLVGGTGGGKTQLAHDLAGYCGDSFCYMIGRPDFEPSELLKQLRLDRIREATTDRELVELTEHVKKTLYYVDELNRCPPIVQNYFFDFMDGKLIHNGQIHQLGKHGYSLGFASGNIGDGAYVGISDTDRALRDRMHMIVKLDYPDFETQESDDFKIFSSKKDPRASIPKTSEDCLDGLIELHRKFGERQVPMILPLLGLYFHKGLDYLQNTPKHSKRAVDEKWPNVEGIRQDTDEAQIFPLSKRAIFSLIALSQAIEMIAESRGLEIKSSVPIFLDSLKFTVPYSGVLAEPFVYSMHGSDAYAAFDSVMEKIRYDIQTEKLPRLEEALLLAEAGEKNISLFDEIANLQNPAQGKWHPVRNAISIYADKRKENPSEEGIKLKEVIEKAKENVNQ